jgi:hypothetical protein
MVNFLPLAHGALGFWDELLPIVMIGAFFVLIVVVGLMSRRNEAALEQDGKVKQDKPDHHAETTDDPDHVRLS